MPGTGRRALRAGCQGTASGARPIIIATSAGLIDGTFTLDSRIAMRSVQFLKWLSPGKVLVGGVPNSGTANRFDGACVFLIDENGALDTAYISNMYPAWIGTLPNDFFTSSGLQMYNLRGGSIPTGANRTTGVYEVLVDEEGEVDTDDVISEVFSDGN